MPAPQNYVKAYGPFATQDDLLVFLDSVDGPVPGDKAGSRNGYVMVADPTTTDGALVYMTQTFHWEIHMLPAWIVENTPA